MLEIDAMIKMSDLITDSGPRGTPAKCQPGSHNRGRGESVPPTSAAILPNLKFAGFMVPRKTFLTSCGEGGEIYAFSLARADLERSLFDFGESNCTKGTVIIHTESALAGDNTAQSVHV